MLREFIRACFIAYVNYTRPIRPSKPSDIFSLNYFYVFFLWKKMDSSFWLEPRIQTFSNPHTLLSDHSPRVAVLSTNTHKLDPRYRCTKLYLLNNAATRGNCLPLSFLIFLSPIPYSCLSTLVSANQILLFNLWTLHFVQRQVPPRSTVTINPLKFWITWSRFSKCKRKKGFLWEACLFEISRQLTLANWDRLDRS